MRILLYLALTLTVAGCVPALPSSPPAPLSSPAPNVPRPDDFRKLGPELRRYLLQRGRQALRPLDKRRPERVEGLGTPQAQDEALRLPETLREQLRPIPVVIQAQRDITGTLEELGVRVRSVNQDGVVVITAEVPPAAIPRLLALPDLMTMELAQPVPPAEEDGG
ncbi:MAG: hypothetical protein ACE5F6_01390 [Anaerolineae bacterium]